MSDPAFLRRTLKGVTVELRVQPGARRTALACSAGGVLKAAVTAPAEEGKANAAVVALLAALAPAEIGLRRHEGRCRA